MKPITNEIIENKSQTALFKKELACHHVIFNLLLLQWRHLLTNLSNRISNKCPSIVKRQMIDIDIGY